jgi:hypothetical protein
MAARRFRMVIMPQADSFTNALVLTISIPSFVLLSLIVDDTTEDENIDEHGDILLERGYDCDSSCSNINRFLNQIFNVKPYALKFLTIASYFKHKLFRFMRSFFIKDVEDTKNTKGLISLYYTFNLFYLVQGNFVSFELNFND